MCNLTPTLGTRTGLKKSRFQETLPAAPRGGRVVLVVERRLVSLITVAGLARKLSLRFGDWGGTSPFGNSSWSFQRVMHRVQDLWPSLSTEDSLPGASQSPGCCSTACQGAGWSEPAGEEAGCGHGGSGGGGGWDLHWVWWHPLPYKRLK